MARLGGCSEGYGQVVRFVYDDGVPAGRFRTQVWRRVGDQRYSFRKDSLEETESTLAAHSGNWPILSRVSWAEFRQKAGDWLYVYNHHRPHKTLGDTRLQTRNYNPTCRLSIGAVSSCSYKVPPRTALTMRSQSGVPRGVVLSSMGGARLQFRATSHRQVGYERSFARYQSAAGT